jgi:hypothetical protein
MPRERRAEAPPESPAPALAPVVIEAAAVGSVSAWARFLGWPPSRLKRAVRGGELQAALVGGCYLVMGEDLLHWIRSGREAAEERRLRCKRKRAS